MPAHEPPDDMPDDLDDRVALLFVACDEALAPGARMVLALRVVCGLTIAQTAMHLGIQESAAAARLTRAKRTLAQARGEFRVPEPAERSQRLPAVLDCVAGMFTVAHRSWLEPPDALSDMGRQALSIADALVALFPDETEVHGLRAVVRLGLARRPGRVADGVAMTLDEVDRSRWDQGAGARRTGGRRGRGAGRRPVRARGGDLGTAHRGAVLRADRLAADRAALRGPATGVAVAVGGSSRCSPRRPSSRRTTTTSLVGSRKVCSGWPTRGRRTPAGMRRSPWQTCAGAPAVATRRRSATGRSPARSRTTRSAGSACAGPASRLRKPARGTTQRRPIGPPSRP